MRTTGDTPRDEATGRAAAHDLVREGPAPRFLEGALLGNGGLGVTVTTRPDAVVLHLGHNDVWDRRVDESHAGDILTFREVLDRVEAIDPDAQRVEDDPWFAAYRARMVAPYAKPYPRPLGCGSLILGFDRRHTELIGHRVELATGLCRVELLHRGATVHLEVFVDHEYDDVHLRCVGPNGRAVPAPFTRLRLLPDPDGPAASETGQAGETGETVRTTFILPRPGDVPLRAAVRERDLGPDAIGFTETLPVLRPGEFGGEIAVDVRATAELGRTERPDWYGGTTPTPPLERTVAGEAPFWAVLRLRHTYDPAERGRAAYSGSPAAPGPAHWEDRATRTRQDWAEYWSRSHLVLSDLYLERVWYRNTYFAHCALRPGRSAPGLFGNWIHRDHGAAWHGDYHLNYNAQQVYWGTFSSNRVEQHLPYVALVEHIAPVARGWARDYYRMRGAAYPHSAYNAPMTVNPYPNPVWAWEVSESPWTVQSLWWHYLYTRDLDFLRERAMPLLEDVVLFLVDYLSRPDTRDERWDDDLVHIYPTVPPELYGLSPGLRLNADCLIDIALVRFVFTAFRTACDELGVADRKRPLLDDVRRIQDALPPYPTAETPDGPVFVSVPGESPDVVYNVPLPGMTVFPGEDHSWESDPRTVELATRSVRRQRIEGGNDLVFANLQAARLGILDLDRFRRQLRYCELGNGTFTDMTLQVHGRYNDATPFEFMAGKGVWTENFALTAVVNELLLQSYSGTLRLFPNCDGLRGARFHRLRAIGAFLVSAEMTDGTVAWVEIVSEAGSPLRLLIPWDDGAVLDRDGHQTRVGPGIITLDTVAGETLRLTSP